MGHARWREPEILVQCRSALFAVEESFKRRSATRVQYGNADLNLGLAARGQGTPVGPRHVPKKESSRCLVRISWSCRLAGFSRCPFQDHLAIPIAHLPGFRRDVFIICWPSFVVNSGSSGPRISLSRKTRVPLASPILAVLDVYYGHVYFQAEELSS
jgi:hypothetical protein